MAKPEHIDIVNQGADAVRQWKATSSELLDLEGANLAGIELPGADLAGATLSGANLSAANLEHAALRDALIESADLFSARLFGANLTGARLTSSTLFHSDLRDADLRRASFFGANLTGVQLEGARFDGATFLETVLADICFKGAGGLEQIEHAGPSVIDLRTLRASWPLPLVFLRGIGLPDDLIDYLRSFLGQAVEYYSCFVSYSSQDQQFADRLYDDLQNNGVRCWFAPEDLRIGDKFRSRIDEAIRLHDKLLLILSEHAVASSWVESEVEAAFEKERQAKERDEERTVLFPVRLDGAVMESKTAWAAEIRRTRHIGDFSRWKEHGEYQRAFSRLMRDLKQGDAAKSPAI